MSFENKICNIVGDLIPLYCDDMCSEESRSAVEEHTAECEKCRRLLESCSAELKNVSQKTDIKSQKIIGRVRRKFLVTAVVSSVAVLFAVLFGIYHLTGKNMGYFLADKRIFGISEEKLMENSIDIVKYGVNLAALETNDIECDLVEYNRLSRELYQTEVLPQSFSVTYDRTKSDITGEVVFKGKAKTESYDLTVQLTTRRMRAGVYLVSDIVVWWENYYPDRAAYAESDTSNEFYITSGKYPDETVLRELQTRSPLMTVQIAEAPKAGRYYLDGNKNGLYMELSEDGKATCGGMTFEEFYRFYEEKYGNEGTLPYSGIFELMFAQKNGEEVSFSAVERDLEQVGEDGRMFISESKRLLIFAPPPSERFAAKDYFEECFRYIGDIGLEYSSDGIITDIPSGREDEPLKFIRSE